MSTLKMWQPSCTLRLGLPLALGLCLTIGLLLAMGALHPHYAVLAQGSCTRYVAPPPSGNDSGNNCANRGAPCATIQHAVDEADPGDVICVASGVYTDIHVRPRNDIETTGVVTQVVYIDKTVTIGGGYTTAFDEPPDPVANPATLDANDQGRVLYITGDINPTIEGLRLINGDANGMGGWYPGLDWDSGGGAYVISATVAMNNCQVLSGYAIRGGGVFFLNSNGSTLGTNVVSDNRAFTAGGGLHFEYSDSATLVNNTIHKNVANHLGGGMKFYGGVFFNFSHNATLYGNTISENFAANDCGGACFRASDNATLIGNTIISNTARQQGFAGNGGGLYFQVSQNASLLNNTIAYNRGQGDINAGTLHGGGLYAEFSTLALRANKVISNVANRGGGIHVDRGSNVTLINNVVSDNEATAAGSGLYVRSASSSLLHTTVARNSGGDGSGVHITGTLSTVAMTNTILANHTTGVYVAAVNTADINGVLWYNNGTNYDGPGTILPSNEYTGDPAFWDDGYHLTFASAAIDKGVDAGVTTDIDGDPRPCQLGFDLGADEISCRYLPLLMKDWQ